MTPASFLKEIKSAQRRPLYVISGGEPAAMGRCLKAAEEVVSSDFRDFNFQILTLEAGQAGRLVAEAQTAAFVSPPRVVVAKNPAFGAEDWALLSDYLDHPAANTIIIVVDKVDARLKFFKKVKAEGLEVDCLAPKGSALNSWLADEFKSRGVEATNQVCALIIERAGTDLPTLMGEAEKLSLYLGQGGQVTSSLAQEMVSLAPGANIFELGEALGRRDAKSALKLLLDLLSTEHHLPVLAMMVRHFRLMLAIKTRQALLKVSRLGREEASALGMHPYVLEKTQGQVGAWSWQELSDALEALELAHRSFVTTSTPPQMIMEGLALRLTRPKS